MAWHEAGKIVDWKIGQGREILIATCIGRTFGNYVAP